MGSQPKDFRLVRIQNLFEQASVLNRHLRTSALPDILEYAEKQGARWAVLEPTYIDRDFVNEHGALYTHFFRHIPNRCQRVHFFRKRPGPRPVGGNRDYLGYTILRPLPQNAIGRSVLAAPQNPIGDATPLTPTLNEFIPHLAGSPLPVWGTPYCQQDGMMMRCAQAALWTATRVMYKRFRTQLFFPTHINSAAAPHNSMFGRTFPLDDGLHVGTMLAALNELGFLPDLASEDIFNLGKIQPLGVAKTLATSVPFLLSGIPPILAIPGHVVTAVGLYITRSPLRSTWGFPQSDLKSAWRLRPFEDWVAGLTVHDDASRPYAVFPAPEWYGENTRPEAGWLNGTKGPDLDLVDSVLVPSTQDSWLRLRDARTHALRHLCSNSFWLRLRQLSRLDLATSLSAFLKLATSDLVLRWRLIPSKAFKKETLPQRGTLAEELGRAPMPRFIWLGELLWANDLDAEPDLWRVCGEIVVDSTANQFHPCVLAIHLPAVGHLPGTLYLRNPDAGWVDYDRGARVIAIPNDTPRPDRLGRWR